MPLNLAVAIFHGEYMKCDADYKYAPLDVPNLRLIQQNWDDIRRKVVGGLLFKYDIFDGLTPGEHLHFNHAKFETYLKKEGLDKQWPRTKKSKARKLDKDPWEAMIAANPELEELHQLYKIVDMDRLNIACDLDGRNRLLLGAMGAITSRNTPGKDDRGTYVFSAAKWARFLIKPPEGWALAGLDWSAQELGINAIRSGDKNLRRTYESGDPYMEFAILAGAAPSGATSKTHPEVRKLYKTAMLAIGYGQEKWGFISKSRVSESVAVRLFKDYRRLYSRYLFWREKQVDNFSVALEMSTKLGWTLHKGVRTEKNTLLNFKGQATGAGMLQLAVIEAMRRGVEVCCPVHDEIVIQAPVGRIEWAVSQTKAAMNYASATLLDGYVLRIGFDDKKDIIRYSDRFFDKDGEPMWNRISPILDELKGRDTARSSAAT